VLLRMRKKKHLLNVCWTAETPLLIGQNHRKAHEHNERIKGIGEEGRYEKQGGVNADIVPTGG